MKSTLIDQGLNLMLFGMGTVFIFLTILVFATRAMSLLVNRFAADTSEELDAPNTNSNKASTNSAPSADVLEAIKKAISAHRAR